VFRPSRTRVRHRLYHRSEVERFLEINHLLFNEKYTFDGAKKVLQEMEHQKRSKGRVRCAAGNEMNVKQHRSADEAVPARAALRVKDTESLLADVRKASKELLQMLETVRPSSYST
jgi:DNA-binding transcriptional MerR regulator